jgi:hypothetical protein
LFGAKFAEAGGPRAVFGGGSGDSTGAGGIFDGNDGGEHSGNSALSYLATAFGVAPKHEAALNSECDLQRFVASDPAAAIAAKESPVILIGWEAPWNWDEQSFMVSALCMTNDVNA